MKVRIFALAAVIFAATALHAARQPPVPYTAVEVDRFVSAPGVAFPTDSQSGLAEDIAREISLAFETVAMVRQGEAAPHGRALLRISGVVTRFKPFGPDTAILRVKVWFIDAATGQVLLNREVKGINSENLAKKIVKFCNSTHLLESN
jgi:hypothetical protein